MDKAEVEKMAYTLAKNYKTKKNKQEAIIGTLDDLEINSALTSVETMKLIGSMWHAIDAWEDIR